MSTTYSTKSATSLNDEPILSTFAIIIAAVFGILFIITCIGFLIFGYIQIRKQPEREKPEPEAPLINEEAVKVDEQQPIEAPVVANNNGIGVATTGPKADGNHPSTFCENSLVSQAILPSQASQN